MSLSVVVPVFDERENLPILHAQLLETLRGFDPEFEIIFVDDGSTDGSGELLESLAMQDSRIRVVRFRKNFGLTAAFAAGIRFARYDTVVTLDADLQNDPRDIPLLVDTLQRQGYDAVCGWRHDREDAFLSRTLPSVIANKIISWTTKVPIHDTGCSLRAYKRDVIQEIDLYGEMHRFLPALITWIGGRLGEVKVAHHPRKFGKSKADLRRTVKVILDLMTVKFLRDYSTKPNYIFGGFGLLNLALSVIAFAIVAYRTLILGNPEATPMVFFMVIFFLVGFLSIFVGLLAELVIHASHEAQKRPPYHIKSTTNIGVGDRRTAWKD